MIRLFFLFGKLESLNVSSLRIFNEAMNAFDLHHESCPCCKAKGNLSFHDGYSRDLIVYESGRVCCHNIPIKRVMCSSCGHTHAVLPSVLVPYGSYSLLFILRVLREYFNRRCSVRALCECFSIAVSTLYTWKRLFLKHKTLWLGVLEDLRLSAVSFLNGLLASELPSFLGLFFDLSAFSFLQNARSPSPYLSG